MFRSIVLVANSVNLVLAFAGFAFCLFVTGKYLIQMDRKLFVVLHYTFAVPLLLSDVAQAIAIYIELPEDEKTFDLEAPITNNFISITNGVHEILYIGLVLQMICGIATVSTSLRLLLMHGNYSKTPNLDFTERNRLRQLLAMKIIAFLLFISSIGFMVYCFASNTDVLHETMLYFNLVIIVLLIIIYVIWLFNVFYQMNQLQKRLLQLQ